jgi:hypothetical protein
MADVIAQTSNSNAESFGADSNDRSIRPVIEHALTVYYDGNAELARTLIDRLLAENRSD